MNDRRRQISILSRSACLAERDDSCRKLLLRNKKIPARRDVWSDLSNSARSDLNTGKYRRGSRPREIRQFYSPSADFSGFAQRIGNPFDTVAARRPHGAVHSGSAFGSMSGNRKNGTRIDQVDTANKERTVTNPTRYSLLATYYTPEAPNG